MWPDGNHRIPGVSPQLFQPGEPIRSPLTGQPVQGKDLIEHIARQQELAERIMSAQMRTIAALVKQLGPVKLTDQEIESVDPKAVKIDHEGGVVTLAYVEPEWADVGSQS